MKSFVHKLGLSIKSPDSKVHEAHMHGAHMGLTGPR